MQQKNHDEDPRAALPDRSRKKRIAYDAHSRRLIRRFLADWVFPRWRSLLGALAVTTMLAGATGAYPVVIKASFDMLMKHEQAVLLYVLAAIIGVTLLRSLLLFWHAIVTNRIVLRMGADIQQTAFSHLIAADFARLTRDAPGRLMSKLTNDVAAIQLAVQAGVNTAVRDALLVTALLASMIYLDWIMSLIVLGAYPLAALPVAILSDRLRNVARRTQAQVGDMTALLAENLSGARLIKTYGLERYASERTNRSFEQVLSLRMKAVRNRARLDPLLEAAGGVAIAGVVALAYWRISNGISTVGDFMGFVTALLMAGQPIRALGNLSGKIQEGLAGVESLYGMLDEKPAIVDRAGAGPLRIADGAIVFENVAFAYDGAAMIPAVSGFSLVMKGGTTVALVGRSGAGKSTVVNLVPRLFDVTGGRIEIDGQDIRDVTLASLRRAISIVSQDVTLFDDTIRANIGLGRLDATSDEIRAAAKAAAADEFILAQPLGYETVIGDRGFRLSGGQRQRLALARAILKDAPILLLDEATSALDTESERLVQEALARFTRNRTTLVIAHRLSTVRNASMICVMESGRIIELGSHAELVRSGGAYARLVNSQALSDDLPLSGAVA